MITGPSGSGKSSLAIDTIFAEGQRQYIETLSVHSRQFLDQLPRPHVDLISGLQPTLCIDQTRAQPNRRSTVGTATEIYDFLRVVMTRVADFHCWKCNKPIRQMSEEQIAERVESLPEKTKVLVMAPMVRKRKGEYRETLEEVQKAGLVRVRVNGEVCDVEQIPSLSKNKANSIEAVVDRLIIRDGVHDRLVESIDLALKLGNGATIISHDASEAVGEQETIWTDLDFSTRFACRDCDVELTEIEPRSFSFNSPYGACSSCNGLGVVEQPEESSEDVVCQRCMGSRLGPHASSASLGGKTIQELVELPNDRLLKFFENLQLSDWQSQVGGKPINEIKNRLSYLCQVGLSYLTLSRAADTLSGGEFQRVRLATSIGSGLAGVCYVLDEPTIGLHPHDNQRIIESIKNLQTNGNTVLIVEHDGEVMRAADRLIEIGPAAGSQGGQLTADGTVEEFKNSKCLTAKYLADDQTAKLLRSPKSNGEATLNEQVAIHEATIHNLNKLDITIPLGQLVVLTGISGSGKSSLVDFVIKPNLRNHLNQRSSDPIHCQDFKVPAKVTDLVVVDQSPIGRNNRSTAATYSGVLNQIRKVFAATKLAKQLGFSSQRFSFNSTDGRCSECRGLGEKTLKNSFLPDMVVNCPQCHGRRYNHQTLQVRYRGQSIADVLSMSINSAREFFENFEKIVRVLDEFKRVGLGYLKLGQAATQLSGGEAQRVKLATELAKANEFQHTFYMMDEPTIGLHFSDVERFLKLINRLVEKGNSLLIVEHNMSVIAAADWVIDLGPEGGENGGNVVASGTPTQLFNANCPESHTVRHLKKYFEKAS